MPDVREARGARASSWHRLTGFVQLHVWGMPLWTGPPYPGVYAQLTPDEAERLRDDLTAYLALADEKHEHNADCYNNHNDPTTPYCRSADSGMESSDG